MVTMYASENFVYFLIYNMDEALPDRFSKLQIQKVKRQSFNEF